MRILYQTSCILLMVFKITATFGLIPDCPADLVVALYDVATGCVSDVMREPTFQDYLTLEAMTNISYWNQYCSHWETTEPCLTRAFPKCAEDYRARVLNAAVSRGMGYKNGFSPGGLNDVNTHRKMCHHGMFRSDILAEFQTDDFKSCVRHWHSNKFRHCYVELIEELVSLGNIGFNSSVAPKLKKHIHRWELSTFQCILSIFSSHCTERAQHLLVKLVDLTLPNEVQVNTEHVALRRDTVSYEGKRVTVGMFGTGHVVMDGARDPQACHMEGRKLLLQNHFFRLYATSVKSSSGESKLPSHIGEVSVDFLSNDGSVLVKYVGGQGELPTTFADGSQSFQENSTYSASRSILIESRAEEYSISIIHQETSSVIMVTLWKQYYSALVRTPEALLATSYGLLVTGCHLKDISLVEVPDSKACHNVCRSTPEEPVSPPMLRLCVHDCATLGSQALNMTKAYMGAQDFIRELDQHVFNLRNADKQSAVSASEACGLLICLSCDNFYLVSTALIIALIYMIPGIR